MKWFWTKKKQLDETLTFTQFELITMSDNDIALKVLIHANKLGMEGKQITGIDYADSYIDRTRTIKFAIAK